jgi:glutamate-5-semialdehyde dehydrogenase
MSSDSPIVKTARAARQASVALQSVTNEQKNEALLRIKQVLAERKAEIFEANEIDKKVSPWFPS